MPNLFGLNIAKIVNDSVAQAGGVLSATLIKSTPGTRTPGDLAAGTNPTTANKTCRGFIEDRSDVYRNGTLVRQGGRFVTLLGASIQDGAVPEPGDSVTIEGVTYKITGVPERDPAAATFVMRVEV